MTTTRAGDPKRRRTFLYLWILLALAVLLTASTYTWFYISRRPHVNDMALHVNTRGGLQISTSADAPDEDWLTYLDYSDLVGDDYPLKPVTWSGAQNRFLTVTYGLDGRLYGYRELSDDRNANRRGSEGYYVMCTYFMRTDTPCEVSLAEAVKVNGGENGAGTYVIGSPEWDAEKMCHTDAGNGAERAIRIGFRITPSDAGESDFFVYEPNCAASDGSGFHQTTSVDGSSALAYGKMIFQAYSGWTEADPVLHGTTIKELGQFLVNKPLFRIEPGQVVRIDMYIWLEGRDPDCFSRYRESKLQANIQFDADYSGQSGLDEIKE